MHFQFHIFTNKIIVIKMVYAHKEWHDFHVYQLNLIA